MVACRSDYKACLLRFRPILMTTWQRFSVPCLLALGVGVGSELRRPSASPSVGGLILSQMLTLFTTPVVYIYMDVCNPGCGARSPTLPHPYLRRKQTDPSHRRTSPHSSMASTTFLLAKEIKVYRRVYSWTPAFQGSHLPLLGVTPETWN